MRKIDRVVVQRSREQTLRDRKLLQDLVKLRRDKERTQGLTQGAIANRMGTAQPNVSRLESGEFDVRRQTLRKYATAMGAAIEYEVIDLDKPLVRPAPQFTPKWAHRTRVFQ